MIPLKLQPEMGCGERALQGNTRRPRMSSDNHAEQIIKARRPYDKQGRKEPKRQTHSLCCRVPSLYSPVTAFFFCFFPSFSPVCVFHLLSLLRLGPAPQYCWGRRGRGSHTKGGKEKSLLCICSMFWNLQVILLVFFLFFFSGSRRFGGFFLGLVNPSFPLPLSKHPTGNRRFLVGKCMLSNYPFPFPFPTYRCVSTR